MSSRAFGNNFWKILANCWPALHKRAHTVFMENTQEGLFPRGLMSGRAHVREGLCPGGVLCPEGLLTAHLLGFEKVWDFSLSRWALPLSSELGLLIFERFCSSSFVN